MIEKDAIASVQPIAFPVIDSDPVGVELRHTVRAARVERSFLGLWHLLHQPVQLRRTGLIEARFVFQPQKANRLQQTERPHAIHICCVFRRLKADGNVALRAKVVDLIRLRLRDDACQIAAVRQVTVVQVKVAAVLVWVVVDVINPLRVERRRPALDAVYLVTLFKQ